MLRDSLCEIFWKERDDPSLFDYIASLRQISVSNIRKLASCYIAFVFAPLSAGVFLFCNDVLIFTNDRRVFFVRLKLFHVNDAL